MNKASEWKRKNKKESTINLGIMYIKSKMRIENKTEKNEQQNNKFNCFLVRLLSHIRSCFLVDMDYFSCCCSDSFRFFPLGVVLFGVKSHVKFSKHHFAHSQTVHH
jgi:hypothetical protein